MMGSRRILVASAFALSALAIAGCTRTLGEGDSDIDAARTFDGFPLYWVGERFEKWDLEYFDVSPGGVAVISYGTCEIEGGEEGGRPAWLASRRGARACSRRAR